MKPSRRGFLGRVLGIGAALPVANEIVPRSIVGHDAIQPATSPIIDNTGPLGLDLEASCFVEMRQSQLIVEASWLGSKVIKL